MSKIINGKELALEHEERLKQKLFSLYFHTPPILVSFVNEEDEPSVKYTGMKAKKAAEIGLDFRQEPVNSKTRLLDIEEKIKKYNLDKTIDGIMVQLPFNKNVLGEKNVEDILNLIVPQKDVDGLTASSPYTPATVKGIISILQSEGVLNKNKVFKVVGGVHGAVGTALVRKLQELEEDAEGLSKKDPDLKAKTILADVLVSAVGQKNLITEEMVKEGSLVIDVGRDVDFENVLRKADRITPPTGGVGPMTVISLMENMVEAYTSRNDSVCQ